jgi:subfamily B ATP-binding cassette protein MsbA
MAKKKLTRKKIKQTTYTEDFLLYRRLLLYMKKYYITVLLGFIGFGILAASQPMLAKMMELITAAIQNKDVEARWTLPFYAIGIYLIRGVGTFIGNYFTFQVGASVVRDIRQELFNHMTNLPASYYEFRTQGEMLSLMTNGVRSIQELVTNAWKTILMQGMSAITLIGYVFYLNWKLSVIFLVIAPLLLALVQVSARKLRSIGRKSELQLGGTMQVAKEMIGNLGVVKAFGATGYEQERYREALDIAFRLQMKTRKVLAITGPLLQFIIAIGIATLVFVLLNPETLQTYTAPELIGYLTAFALIPKPMRQLSNIGLSIQQGLIGAELIYEILDAPPEEDNGTVERERVDGEIRFDNVTFQYPRGNQPALRNLSLRIKPGETLALVGKSGSGKSTLVSLIYRLHDPQEGTVSIDGIPVKDFTLENLRKHISVVNQHVALFDDTIRNNIAYGEERYTDQEITDAAHNAYASEFIAEQEEGIQTMAGESGLRLSGGQRQRIAIARAFLKNAPILILDEATSALDNESESYIKKAVETVMKNRTSIVIAHRLSTIEKADRVLVMQEGQITEEGTHAELLAHGGYYARLVNSAEFSAKAEDTDAV